MSGKITEEEIIDFYKTNNGIFIRREDLQRPSKDFVLQLYVRISEQFDVYNLNQPDILACNNGVSEHMEQAYLINNVYAVMNRFVSSVGLNDFKMMDILEPKRFRTIRILHAMANYYVRYNTIKAEWFEYAEKFTNLHHAKKELAKRKLDLKHSIEDKSMLLSSLKNKSIGQEKELKAYEETFTAKKCEAEKEEKKAAQIKSEITTLKEKLCDIKLEIDQLVESNKKLSQKIIESPMKIIAAKNELEKKLETLKEEYPVLKSQQNDLLTKKTCYSNSIETLIDAMKELKELFELQTKNDEQCKELEEVIKNTGQLDEEMKQIEIQKKNVEESVKSLKGIIHKENAEYLRQKRVHTELLEGLQNKVKTHEQQFGQIEGSNSAKLDRLHQLEAEMEDLNQREQELWQRQSHVHRSNVEKIFTMLKHFDKLFDQ